MLLFMDGMAHYDTSRVGLKYTTVDTTACTWSVTAEGRFGNCLKRQALSNSADGYVAVAPLTNRLGYWTPVSGGVCGFAIKVDDLTSINDNRNSANFPQGLFSIMEGAKHHLCVDLNRSGTFTLRGAIATGGSDYILAQSIEGLSSNTWMFVEIKWVISSTVGLLQIRVNGATVMNFSGDTKTHDFLFAPGSQSVWTSVHLFQVQSNVPPLLTMRMCDLYLADLTAPLTDDVHDFLGDGTIDTIMPNAVGSTTGWTPAGAATNWDATNDRPAPDDDGTYVSTLAVGTQDTYNFDDIPAAAQVKAVHVNILARKETEGSAALAPIVHQGSTDYVGPTQGVASLLYDRYITQPYDLNPATSVKFTAGEINAGQFGVKKVS